MRLQCCMLGILAGALAMPAAAGAIEIETSPGFRVGGYFVRKVGKKITIKTRTSDGKEKFVDYELARIKILHELDFKRLERLSPDAPKAYRDYAEELAKQKGDPEARDTAMRLLLIAAHLDSAQFGQAALIRMSELAEQAGAPAEARRCRAMAFLLDSKGDASVLKTNAAKPGQLPKAEAGALQDFLRALQAYRTGHIKAAREAVKGEGIDAVFRAAPGMMSHKAFLQACTDANCSACKSKGSRTCSNCNGKGLVQGMFGQVERCSTCNGMRVIACTDCDGTGVSHAVPDQAMRTILRAELWAIDQLSGAAPSAKNAQSGTWSSILQARQTDAVAPLSLRTITEFDPQKCLYRDGKWVNP